MADDLNDVAGTVAKMFGAAGSGEDDEDAAPPNPYDMNDPGVVERVNKLFDKYLKVGGTTRTTFEWGWFRNLAMVAGAQDIIRQRGTVKLRAAPSYFPKTQTNKMREKSKDILSALMQGRVPIKHLPATDDPAAHATAEIGERVREVVYAEADLDQKENDIGGWFVDTGNVFLVPYYDYDEKFGTAPQPKLGCAQCGGSYGTDDVTEQQIDTDSPQCPTCAPMVGQPGPDGQPMPPAPLTPTPDDTELLPIGALCVDVCSPFEIRGDIRVLAVRDWTWFVRVRRYDKSFAEEKWEYEGGEEDSGNDDGGQTISQHYLDVIAALNDQFNPNGGGFGNSAAGQTRVPKVTAYELYMLPNEDFPDGLCAMRIGSLADNIKEIGPLDTEYGVGVRKGKKFLPLVHGKASALPGRLWGSSPLDDAVPLQHFRNRVERAIDMEIRRMANSMWLNPKGSGIDLFNGEAGWVANYNPMTLGGTTVAKPERIVPQLQYLQYLIEVMKQIDDQIERVVGNFDVGGGDVPSGVSAASALALLDSNRKKSMSPMLREWAKMYLALDEMTLEIARKHWTDSRIRVAAGQNKVWEVSTFMNSDLQGAVRMEIDYQSLFPASEATERAEIEQLIQGGVISGQDPEQRYEILKKFGKLGMLGSADVHTRRAQQEQDAFLKSNGVELPQIVPLVQNSMIHIREHVVFCNGDEFRALSPDVQELMFAHLQAHFVEEGEKRALLAQMQLNPDAAGAVDISAAGAQAAAGGAQQVMGAAGSPPQPGGVPGSNAGSSVGSRALKGTTGAGPNQAKAQEARTRQVMTQPIPDVAASPTASGIPGQ
jgi:hypothetical protein